MAKKNKISKKYELNKADLNKVGKGALIVMGGALLTYATDIIPLIEWGDYKPIIVALSAIGINALRKYLAGKSD